MPPPGPMAPSAGFPSRLRTVLTGPARPSLARPSPARPRRGREDKRRLAGKDRRATDGATVSGWRPRAVPAVPAVPAVGGGGKHRRVLVDPSGQPPTLARSQGAPQLLPHIPGGSISGKCTSRRRPDDDGTITPTSPAFWNSAPGTATKSHPLRRRRRSGGETLYKSGRQVAPDNRPKRHWGQLAISGT